MRGIIKIAFFITLFFSVLNSFAQFDSTNYYSLIDSYEVVSKNNNLDSITLLYNEITPLLNTAPKEAIGAWYLTQVRVYWSKSLDSTLVYLNKSLDIYKSLKDTSRISGLYNNIGIVYRKKGDYQQALSHYTESAKLKSALKDTQSLAKTFNNIGVIYWNQKNHEKSMEYAHKSLNLKLLTKDYKGASQSYNNIGVQFSEMLEIDSAFYYYNKCKQIREDLGEPYYLAEIYSNYGALYLEIYDTLNANALYLDTAEFYFKMGMSITDTLDYPYNEFYNLNGLGQIALKKGNPQKGKLLFQKSYDLAKQLGFKKELMDAAKGVYECAKELNLNHLALKMHEEYHDLYVDVFNEENSSQIASKESEYRLQTQHALDSLKFEQIRKVEKVVFDKKIQIQQYITIAAAIIVVLIVVFLLMLNKRLKITREQKIIIEETNEELNQTNEELAAQRDEIENQKNKIELVHREITDSINYAQRIQEAILPSMQLMNEYLKKGFVLYKPKDVVAGDFYWMEKYDGKIYVAAADCTGHGVPGAIVSVVCSNALSKALLEDSYPDVDLLLNRARKIIVERLAKSSEIKDGMDISLACFDFENMKLEWAGANNPLYLLRNGEIQITKGDKEHIGFTLNPTPFTKHQFDLQKGDTIYLFTDGFPDQFGGEKGKKLGYKNFRDKLIELSSLDMENQNYELETYFDEWKGSEEQVDDVCVIGIRI